MMTTFLDAGRLNQRLGLEQPVETPDASGGAEIAWTEVAVVWAALEPVGAAMRDIAQQSSEVISHRVSLRYRSDIASGWRFTRGNRTFSIITLHDPDETGRYLVCRTEEVGR